MPSRWLARMARYQPNRMLRIINPNLFLQLIVSYKVEYIIHIYYLFACHFTRKCDTNVIFNHSISEDNYVPNSIQGRAGTKGMRGRDGSKGERVCICQVLRPSCGTPGEGHITRQRRTLKTLGEFPSDFHGSNFPDKFTFLMLSPWSACARI